MQMDNTNNSLNNLDNKHYRIDVGGEVNYKQSRVGGILTYVHFKFWNFITESMLCLL